MTNAKPKRRRYDASAHAAAVFAATSDVPAAMSAMQAVAMPRGLVVDLIDRIEGTARANYAAFDRRTKSYPWNDTIWAKADPGGFDLVSRARRVLSAQ